MTDEHHPEGAGKPGAAADDRQPPESVINVEAALARMGRDWGLLRDVAGFFLEDGPALVAEIRAAARRGIPEVVAQRAHSLKGLVSSFDATSAHRAAAEVEQLGWSSRLDVALPLIDALEIEVERVAAAVRAEILDRL